MFTDPILQAMHEKLEPKRLDKIQKMNKTSEDIKALEKILQESCFSDMQMAFPNKGHLSWIRRLLGCDRRLLWHDGVQEKPLIEFPVEQRILVHAMLSDFYAHCFSDCR